MSERAETETLVEAFKRHQATEERAQGTEPLATYLARVLAQLGAARTEHSHAVEKDMEGMSR